MALQRLLRLVVNNARTLRTVAYRITQSPQQKFITRMVLRKLVPGTPFPIMGVWGFVKNNSEPEPVVTTKEVLLAKCDAMFDQGSYKEIYDLLSSYKDSNDVEILWRLSRALFNMSKTASEVEAKKMIYEAHDLICTALKIKEDHYAVHKWMAILLHSKSNCEGMRAKMKILLRVKEHMLRAIELNPRDAMSLYMLGYWCYGVSDLSWYQRKIAAIIFGEPPTSSFEEALKYFNIAEEVEPMFYSHNLLMLGKTYLKLNKNDEALKYLKLASEFPARNDDDQNAKQEATKLLASV